MHFPCTYGSNFFSTIQELVGKLAGEPLIVFTCQYSCHRAPTCANFYRANAAKEQRLAVLEGGFRGWEALGYPVVKKEQFFNDHAQGAFDAHAIKEGPKAASKAGAW
mmetsp:Transcript_50174/g.117866  ORF Transcript_50174/g.117866 Transcript_50174/m.117866 type:complete len:107 (+) Transcript_50174:126-446(+)